MNRRIVTYILFGAVAIYGIGLPQLVHLCVDHGCGWGGAPAGHAHAGCCSTTCSVGETQQDDSGELPHEHEHDCDVCQLLATSTAAMPLVVAVCILAAPAAELRREARSNAAISRYAGSPSPRGPPHRV